MLISKNKNLSQKSLELFSWNKSYPCCLFVVSSEILIERNEILLQP